MTVISPTPAGDYPPWPGTPGRGGRHRFERRAGDASSTFSLAGSAPPRLCRLVTHAIQTRYITMLVSDPLAAARAPHTKDS